MDFLGETRIRHCVEKASHTSKPGLTDMVANALSIGYNLWVRLLILKYCFVGTWIVADTDIPPMERLTIWGVLELEDTHNVETAESSYRRLVLNATYISVQVRVRAL